MIDTTVTQFYSKNPEEHYGDTYDQQHGFRLDAMIAHYNLDLKGQRVADIGGGLGFLGKRLKLDGANGSYWVFDGASIPETQRLCKGLWVQTDIQRADFGSSYWMSRTTVTHSTGDILRSESEVRFDIAFCLETLEHLSDPYHCLVQIKKLVKPNGTIILSIPTETVWHNTVYPGLLWPRQNWEQFLGQMALPIVDFWTYEPKPGQGWPAYHYRCHNADWRESVLAFPKTEDKFRGVTPIQATNL